MKGKKVVATVAGASSGAGPAGADTHAEVKNSSNGDRELTGLQFSGKKYTLELGTESAKAQTKAETAN